MASNPTRLSTPTTPPSWDPESLLALAGALAASTSEFAHDANNLVLQIVAAHELAGDRLGSPIATEDELEQLIAYARNVTTIARDLAQLVEKHDSSGSSDG